jgi:hypothetical protein
VGDGESAPQVPRLRKSREAGTRRVEVRTGSRLDDSVSVATGRPSSARFHGLTTIADVVGACRDAEK